MNIEKVQSAGGFSVGDVLRISCESDSARVVKIQRSYVFVEWPWRQIDTATQRTKWDGTSGFPRDPDHYEWRNTPWRMDPPTQDVRVGDLVILGMPAVEVRVTVIRRFDPPAELGWLPRSELAVGVVPLSDEDDEEAGFNLYLPAAEPLVIEHVTNNSR
jgi:hypothetical protein